MNTQIIVTLVSIEQNSSINVITVTDEDGDEQVLYGDARITEPMHEYIGKQIRVNINHSSDWTWSPLGEFDQESDE